MHEDKKQAGLAWYPRYVGDYARKTKPLTMLEHGAFTLLLDEYYATGKTLLSNAISNSEPMLTSMPDHSRLYRLCGAITKEEQQAVDHVLNNFFEWTDEGYYNSKVAEILEKQHEAHAKRVNAGRKGGRKASSKAGSNANSKDKAKPKQSEPEPEPIKNIYTKDSFDRFFKEYPKKIEPVDAEDAFRDQVEAGEDPEVIIEAARQYAIDQADNDKKYIKSPVKFLDKRVFLSPDYNKPAAKPIDISKFTDWQKALVNDIGVQAVKSWFSGAELRDKVLYVDKFFHMEWIKTHYSPQIQRLGIKEIKLKQKK